MYLSLFIFLFLLFIFQQISRCNILLGLLLLVLIVKRFGSQRERHYINVYIVIIMRSSKTNIP